jgi:hypothetical protein
MRVLYPVVNDDPNPGDLMSEPHLIDFIVDLGAHGDQGGVFSDVFIARVAPNIDVLDGAWRYANTDAGFNVNSTWCVLVQFTGGGTAVTTRDYAQQTLVASGYMPMVELDPVVMPTARRR